MDPKSVRIVIIAISLCVLFALVIGNAFKFLPEDATGATPISVEDLNTGRANNEEVSSEEKKEISTLEDRIRQLEEELDDARAEADNLRQINNKPFEELAGQDANSEVLEFYQKIENGNKNLKSGNYEEALDIFQQALKQATKPYEVSLANIGISKSYAAQRRFGSAISYAQKANNAYSSYETKVLLAKLNYRTGNSIQAEQAMKTLLESEF